MSLYDRVRRRAASALPINPAVRLDDAPICSFTFDDCPSTALMNAGRMLQEAGAGGTFFVAGQLSADPYREDGPYIWGEELLQAHAAGHEIGCHTFTHPSMANLTVAQMQAEFEQNVQAVRRIIPDADLVSFAYPLGEVSFAAKKIVAQRFGAGRGIREGLNGRVVDLSELRACRIFSRGFDRYRIAHLVAECRRQRAWLVFYTHDISPRPSIWGCTPDEFRYVLDVVNRERVEVLTIRAALGRITHRATSTAVA